MPKTLRDITQQRQKKEEKNKRQKLLVPSMLCNAQGAIVDAGGNAISARVEDDSLYVWHRSYGDAAPAKVRHRNPGVADIGGTPVYLGYFEDSQELEVLSVNTDVIATPTNSIPRSQHAQEHEDGYDPLMVYLSMISALRMSPGTGLTVRITSYEYDNTSGIRTVYAGTSSFSVAASQPASGLARKVLVYLDTTDNTIKIVAGATGPDLTTYNLAKPDTPIDGILVGYVRLDGDQTAIAESDLEHPKRLLVPNRTAGGWPFGDILTVDPTDPDADFSTLQDAIDSIAAGGAATIWPGPALYVEDVTITDRNITLALTGDARYVASGSGIAIEGTIAVSSTGVLADMFVTLQSIGSGPNGLDMTIDSNANNLIVTTKYCSFDPPGLTAVTVDVLEGNLIAYGTRFNSGSSYPLAVRTGAFARLNHSLVSGDALNDGGTIQIENSEGLTEITTPGASDTMERLAGAAVEFRANTDWNEGDGFFWNATDGVWEVRALPGLRATLFLHDEASDVAGYEQLLGIPAEDAETTASVVVGSGDGELVIEEFITPPGGLGVSLLNGGVWEFATFASVDNNLGVSEIIIRVYKRDTGGTETELFNTTTGDISGATAAEYGSTVVQGDIAIDPTDRLVIKYFGQTSSVPDRTITLYYEGTANYSHVHTPADAPAGVAPSSASYVTLDLSAALPNERTIADGPGIFITDGGAGNDVTIELEVGGLTEETAADNADSVAIYDDSGAVTRRQTRANFLLADITTTLVDADWYDYQLVDTANASGVTSHFLDNDTSYPAGWTETDAAASTVTNYRYSFWYLAGTSGDTAWDYRQQTDINLESQAASALTTFMVGPIIVKDGRFAADISYYFGIYRDNAGTIDTATYSRVRLYWDSATPAWKVVAEESDGSTPHSTTVTLDSSPLSPLYFAFTVQNAAAKSTRQLWGRVPDVVGMRTNIQNPTAAPTWGQMWVRFHQARGAGINDAILIGALDYLGNVA